MRRRKEFSQFKKRAKRALPPAVTPGIGAKAISSRSFFPFSSSSLLPSLPPFFPFFWHIPFSAFVSQFRDYRGRRERRRSAAAAFAFLNFRDAASENVAAAASAETPRDDDVS